MKSAESRHFSEIIAGCQAVISYIPLRSEVDFREYVTLPENAIVYGIPPRASLDPFSEAQNAMAAVGDRKTIILLPGRRFDARGTRHGQGGGWYDRILSSVPKEWTRIGFCFERQFSKDPLPREAWDQAMDLVVVVLPDGSLAEYANPRT